MSTVPPAAQDNPRPQVVAQNEKTPRQGGLSVLLTTAQSLAVTVIIALFVICFLVQAFQIPSESMEQTLLVGDYLLVDKVHFGHAGGWPRVLPYAPIGRGDIIVFRYPVHPALHFVKRVIALPGDRVHLAGGRVWVNGVLQAEPYAVHDTTEPDYFRDNFPAYRSVPMEVESEWWEEMHARLQGGELVVPPRNYFVLGDNREHSLDSRYWGFVPAQNVIGRPWLIYWSLDHEAAAAARSDKLNRFWYVLVHILQLTRWNRTLHLVQ